MSRFRCYVLFVRLLQLLSEIFSEPDNKTIIFVETKRGVDDVTNLVRRAGYVSHLPIFHSVIFSVICTIILATCVVRAYCTFIRGAYKK